ncbi:WW domain-containing oxidoreductase-like isoform X2 [Paramacrobiotus metropolitanus]|uniref:WW domain-containing oxidoreductase-like isoform X2 n=1 Tax=Paramacrobiotus metropolitanus TaxID=2943436 RepID=UPI002446178B|nr:WW domain-containing oxidoreductase-like isoform X2 [Paramacrobiotus metropolitanus]
MSEKVVRRFYEKSTAAEVLVNENIKGKRFLVTGGTSGIGTSTVEALAEAGGHVVFTGRNNEAGNNLVCSIIKNHPGAIVEYMPVDFCSLKDVKRFAEDFLKKYKRLDVLIFNAGMFGGSHTETEDGYESAAQKCQH